MSPLEVLVVALFSFGLGWLGAWSLLTFWLGRSPK